MDPVVTLGVTYCLDSTNAVSSSVGYRHDNPALTEQRVAQILSEARAAMKAMEAPQSKVSMHCSSDL